MLPPNGDTFWRIRVVWWSSAWFAVVFVLVVLIWQSARI
jgi:hypothetical protein